MMREVRSARTTSNCVVFDSVSKSFSAHSVLSQLSFTLKKNESLAIVGPSGAGKSVLLKLLLGLLVPDSGSISVLNCQLGRETSRLHRNMANQVGMVFQHSALFDSLAVWENIGFVDLQRNVPRVTVREKASRLLMEVGLSASVMDQLPSALSGGMRKRVGIARAIAQKPKLLLCDEPTAGLDPVIGAHIGKLIASTIKHYQTACITITHDIPLAATVANRVALLYRGSFVWQGDAGSIYKSTNPFISQFRSGLPDGPIMQFDTLRP